MANEQTRYEMRGGLRTQLPIPACMHRNSLRQDPYLRFSRRTMQVCFRSPQRNVLRTMVQPAHTEKTLSASFLYTKCAYRPATEFSPRRGERPRRLLLSEAGPVD
jgi:hypothetical protein